MSAQPQVIITAAGPSLALFLEAFGKPKLLCETGQGSLLERVLRPYAAWGSRVHIGLDRFENQTWMLEGIIKENYGNVQTFDIPEDSPGALITALFCAEGLVPENPVFIVAGDSCIEGGLIEADAYFARASVAAGTIVFRSDNPRHSYVRLDSSGRVVGISEKVVVSELATAGIFYFQSLATFLEAAAWVLVNNARVAGNFYVSAALNHLVATGEGVGLLEIPALHYTSWATPDSFRS